MANSAESNVGEETVNINLNVVRQEYTVVPSNFNDDSCGAPIDDAHSSHEKISNIFAAKLAVDRGDFKSNLPKFWETFQQYQKACVQVKSGTTAGSGILYLYSETQVIVVTAAHVINGNSSIKIVLEKDYKTTKNPNVVKAKQVTITLQEPDIKFKPGEDAAVIFLNTTDSQYLIDIVKEFPCPSRPLTLSEHASGFFMAIHYADGDGAYKKVSVGEVGRSSGNFQQLKEQVNIDGGPGASGAPLFNFEGDVVAILKSKEKNYDGIRNVITNVEIERIINYNTGATASHEQNIFEFNEGVKFNKTLSDIRKDLRKSDLNQEDLDSIESLAVFKCLGVGGKHGDTRKYSRKWKIESDHFPPYDAYNQLYEKENCPSQIKAIFDKYSGKRRGENGLPAITIPYVIHRKLDTTASSEESRNFRSAQAEDIAAGNTCEAIRKNFDNYSIKGLFKRSNYNCTDSEFDALLGKYLKGFNTSLKQHKEHGFLDEGRRTFLVGYIEDLVYNDYDSEQLDDPRIISFNFPFELN